jgi:hypothetical protein
MVCVCVVLLTASAKAEDPPPLVLEVRAARVERGELERALRDELASDRAAGEARASGRLELSEGADDVVRLSYRDAAGKLATRDLRIAGDDPEALEKITLAAANLVRDQSALPGELAALSAPVPAALPAAPPAPPPPPPPPPHDPCTTTPVLVFGGDLVPGIGTSSAPGGRDAARRISINFVGGYSAGVRGFEASLAFNIDGRGACGFQGALGFNLAKGEVHGVQLAPVNLALGSVRGAQLGILNFTRRRAMFQLGLANLALEGAGVQLGVANFARGGAGSELGVVNVALAETGAQLGVANLAWGKLRRTQVGVFNIAKDDVPVQVGVVNVSRRARAPIGALSIVREGRTTLDAWATENGTLLAGVSHGGEIVHNIYGAGARVGSKGPRAVFTLGLGGRLFNDRLFTLDFDVLYELVSHTDEFTTDTMLGRARLTGAITLYDRLALIVAAGYAVMDTDDPDEAPQAPFDTDTVLARDKRNADHVVYGFPTVAVGLRLALGPRR